MVGVWKLGREERRQIEPTILSIGGLCSSVVFTGPYSLTILAQFVLLSCHGTGDLALPESTLKASFGCCDFVECVEWQLEVWESRTDEREKYWYPWTNVKFVSNPSGKATWIAVENIKYCILWVCVCSLRYPHAERIHHTVICGLSLCTMFSHNVSKTARFLGNKNRWWK